MRYEMVVSLIAEKIIRFDLAENENLDDRTEFIIGNLGPRDFEGCEASLDIKEIKEIKEDDNNSEAPMD